MKRSIAGWLFVLLFSLAGAVQAAISVVGSSSVDGFSNPISGLILSNPGTQLGDVLLVQVTSGNTNEAIVPPSGWTSFRYGSANSVTQQLFYRIAGAAEPASYTFTFGSGRATGGLLVLRGVDTSGSTPIAAIQGNSGSGLSLIAPSASVSTNNSLVIRYFALGHGNSVLSGPATQRYSLLSGAGPNGVAASASTTIQAAGGVTGTATATAADSASWLAVTVVLAPAPVLEPSVLHYRLTFSSPMLSCNAIPVTVTACADSNCASTVATNNSVTLTPSGAWIGGNIKTFAGSDTLTAYLKRVPGSLLLGVAGGNHSCAGGSCNIQILSSGFVLDVPDVIAGKPALASIQVFEGCQEADAFLDQLAKVHFTHAYSEPTSGTKSVSVTDMDEKSESDGVWLKFEDGKADFKLTYFDAGRVELQASYVPGAEEEGLVMTGSDLFVSKPAGFCVESASPNSDCASGDASCSAFVPAGEGFLLRVKAVAWQADSDTDLCAENATTPNYRQPEPGITLGIDKVAPVATHPVSLGVTSVNFEAADMGEKVLPNQTVSEVGVFTIAATALDYFGEIITGTSANIGRFYPASFVLEKPLLTPACSVGFTYAGLVGKVGPPAQLGKDGEVFTLVGTLSARNKGGGVTHNYIDGFVKLEEADIAYADSDGVGTLAVASTKLTVPGAYGDGYLDYSAHEATFLFDAPQAPHNLKVRVTATDDDLVTGSATDEDGSDFRLGRARIGNAHGSELSNLLLPFTVEYFNGNTYAPNQLDSCTDFDPAALGVYQANGSGSGEPVLSYLNSLGQVDSPYVASGGTSLLGGYQLSAPGAGSTGSAVVTYDTPSWLQFDWNDDNALDDASGLATFGIYRGSTPLIFRREIYR